MDNDRQTVRIILNEKLTSFYTEDFARILNDYLQNMDIGSIKKANSISVPNGCEPSVCDVEFEITANEIPDTDIVLEKTSEILDNINVGAGTVIEYCLAQFGFVVGKQNAIHRYPSFDYTITHRCVVCVRKTKKGKVPFLRGGSLFVIALFSRVTND